MKKPKIKLILPFMIILAIVILEPLARLKQHPETCDHGTPLHYSAQDTGRSDWL